MLSKSMIIIIEQSSNELVGWGIIIASNILRALYSRKIELKQQLGSSVRVVLLAAFLKKIVVG